ncbi:MAG TPA: TspO/MBR family protein [Candidatus Saccharimonadales bacterium]|nr:TspO/MBR family protein [Candidatus Saccharimonadales bacterium]
MMIRNSVRFFLSLAIVSIAAWVGSIVTYPSINSWYAALDKPFFNPPNWVFGPVWTVLYLLMAISLYLVWSSQTSRSKKLALSVFGVQLALNTAWSIVFFGLNQPWTGVAVIVVMWLAIAVTMAAFWPISKLATYLLAPYIAWVSFATGLNISIALLNPANPVDTYEECVRAQGSTIMDIYPPICMTKDKKQFTDPSAKPVTPPAQGTLSIPELGAKIPLQSGISDAYYNYDQASGEAYLTTTKLEENLKTFKGCSSGLHGLYIKKESRQLKEQPHIETLCMPLSNMASERIYAIQEMLRTAIAAATLE